MFGSRERRGSRTQTIASPTADAKRRPLLPASLEIPTLRRLLVALAGGSRTWIRLAGCDRGPSLPRRRLPDADPPRWLRPVVDPPRRTLPVVDPPRRRRLVVRGRCGSASPAALRPGLPRHRRLVIQVTSRRRLLGPTTTCARDCVAERGDAYLCSALSWTQNGCSDCVVCWSVCFVGKSTVRDLFCVWVALWVLCWRQSKTTPNESFIGVSCTLISMPCRII